MVSAPHIAKMPMMLGRHGAAGVAMALLLSGCIKVGPDFSPPPAAVADQWLDTSGPAVSPWRH